MTVSEQTPPEGWAEVATKGDLELIKRDLEMIELKFEARLANSLRAQTYAVLGGFTVIATALTVINRV